MAPIKSNSSCCVPFCHSLKRKSPSLRFFRFPKDESRSKEWVAAIRRPDFVDKHPDNLHKSYRVCSLHFLPNNYSNEMEKRLKWNAIPSIFTWPKDNRLHKTKKPYAIQPVLVSNRSSAPKVLSIDDFLVVDLETTISSPPAVDNVGSVIISHPLSANRTIYPKPSMNLSALPAVLSGQPPYSTFCATSDSGQFVVCGLNQVPGNQMVIDNRLFVCNTNQIVRTVDNVGCFCNIVAVAANSKQSPGNIVHKPTESGKHNGNVPQNIKLKYSKKLISSRKKKVTECLSFLRRQIGGFLYTSVETALKNTERKSLNPKESRLPAKSAIMKVLSESPDFSKHLFSILRSIVCKMKQSDKFCTLAFDEARSSKVSSALLLMVRGVCSNWTLPVCYFTGNTMSSSTTLKRVILGLVEQLQGCGLHVVVLLCRQTTRNELLYRLLGIDEENPFVEVNGNRVFGMYDAGHLLKSFLDDVRAESDEWCAIEEFYGHDSEMPLRIAPKLTEEHFNSMVPFKKRQVWYAAQVLSSTVASAIYTYMALGKLPVTVLDTVNLCSNMDRLYDSMSGNELKIVNEAKPLLAPCTESSAHDAFWTESLDFVRSWTCRSKGKAIRRRGWLLSISSMKNLARSLRQSGVTRFFPGNIALEPLGHLLRTAVTSRKGVCSVFQRVATAKLVNMREHFC